MLWSEETTSSSENGDDGREQFDLERSGRPTMTRFIGTPTNDRSLKFSEECAVCLAIGETGGSATKHDVRRAAEIILGVPSGALKAKTSAIEELIRAQEEHLEDFEPGSGEAKAGDSDSSASLSSSNDDDEEDEDEEDLGSDDEKVAGVSRSQGDEDELAGSDPVIQSPQIETVDPLPYHGPDASINWQNQTPGEEDNGTGEAKACDSFGRTARAPWTGTGRPNSAAALGTEEERDERIRDEIRIFGLGTEDDSPSRALWKATRAAALLKRYLEDPGFTPSRVRNRMRDLPCCSCNILKGRCTKFNALLKRDFSQPGDLDLAKAHYNVKTPGVSWVRTAAPAGSPVDWP